MPEIEANMLKVVLIYILGLIIILLHAKDKFNTPTYDKNAMGPFAQLPPQSLTIDARYRHGRAVYIALMLCIYTAICLVGPEAFSNIMAAAGASTPSATSKNADVWPVAAAAFLISTSAASDSSLLGRIELFIRQYAHEAAYIPSAVSDLAFSLRSLEIKQWLLENPYVEKKDLEERKRALAALVGPDTIAKIEQNPDQEDELAAWVRANILFHILQQIFNKQITSLGARLDHLVDLEQNKQIFERLRAERDRLARQFPAGVERSDNESGKTFSEVQQFSKDTSLLIAVLLSQTARNLNFLTDHLDQLGFQGVDLRERSDHFTYVTLVNLFILAGSGLACVLLLLMELRHLEASLRWPEGGIYIGFATIVTGTVGYLVLFKVLDYSRDRLLDSFNWRENLESYVRLVTTASVLSCLVSITLLVLLFSVFGRLELIANGPVAFVLLVLFQILVAAIGTSFGLIYMRQAARLRRDKTRLPQDLVSGVALIHAAIAAVLVGVLNYSMYVYNVRSAPGDAFKAIEGAWTAIQQDPKAGITAMYNDERRGDISRLLKGVGRSLSRSDGGSAGEKRAKEIADIQKICGILNAPAAPSTAPAAQARSSLFAGPNSCEIGNPEDGDPRIGLAVSLNYLIQSIDHVQKLNSPELRVWLFPGLTAFLIAYAFGVGSRHWRAWWLNNDAKRVAETKEQICRAYGNSIDVDKCLTHPLDLLGHVTPAEALRYEDYRAKLYGAVQKRKIVWPADFFRSEADSADTESAARTRPLEVLAPAG